MKKTFLSDIVGNDYLSWGKERVIFDAGTGSGKSYFCINVLAKYAAANGKKLLYLCNRAELRKDIYQRVKMAGVERTVSVMTYQSIEEKISKREKMGNFDYVCVDEAHYFTSDAVFNQRTDLSYRYIKELSNTVVIYMSATAKVFFKHLLDKEMVPAKNIYHIPQNYDHVEEVCFYQKRDLLPLLDGLLEKENGEKILVFCNSAKRLKEIHKYYQNTRWKDDIQFMCSQYNTDKELHRFCRTDIIQNNTFTGRILVTTSVLDNGVDLKDRKLRYIFTEIIDVDKMQQSIGRKRSLGEDDSCIIYIADLKNNIFSGKINSIKAELKMANLFKNDKEGFFKQYGRDRNLMKNKVFWFDQQGEGNDYRWRINSMIWTKYLIDIKIFKDIMDIGYREYVINLLGEEEIRTKIREADVHKKTRNALLDFLMSIENQPLYVTSNIMEEIRRQFASAGCTIRKDVKRPMSTYNGFLDDKCGDYPYRFVNKDARGKQLQDEHRKLADGTDNPYYRKTYWLLKHT